MNIPILKFLSTFCFLLCVTVSFAQHPPYWSEIQSFRRSDSISAPPKKVILFVGSSSFRLWKEIQHDFPNHTIINRAFGGSSFPDVIRYANDIILPYNAKQVVIYCGENDLASSDSVTAQIVFDRFKVLFDIIRNQSPKTNIVFVSIKPSPSRDRIQSKVIEANKLIEAFLKTKKRTAYVNVYDLMIDSEGRPIKELFQNDMLHMKPNGYAIWKKAIEPYLIR
ncbi:MAG TPA: GDSL-type esterase/lipase family protein [Chryseolinea sp.]|nr:GDSL-type esterase/lipase family protein [Chryseolinea sp.]HPM32830.1 GDSL-type esterase/lipase family protein [Chryseolinea sp.]